MTVVFHIDNLILAYMKPAINAKFIKILDRIYRSKDPLMVTRSKIHEYLRITINFSVRGVFVII